MTTRNRRQFLKYAGGAAVLGLAGCGGGEESRSSTPATDAVEDAAAAANEAAEQAANAAESAAEEVQSAAEEVMDDAKEMVDDAAAATSNLPPLSEDDPQAKALSYVDDATTVDASTQPRFEPGQNCSNCVLYLGGDQPRGGCSIFPGRSVKATGWCATYAPKAS